ncbi:MAG: GNAT family N-acetyltransferase [Candidatus Promineofilum sp.]|nr:GNAT family N-acetyltransferase [Promineifilum sp.]
MPYFNYSIHVAEAGAASYWERRAFLNAWWSLYEDDSRWTPPEFARLRRELDPRRDEHLARLEATLIHIDALHRTGVRRSRTDQQEIPLVSVIERPLAAALTIVDPRRKGQTAYLALPHLGRDKEAFDHLYDHLVESLSARGYHRLITPVGLSPHLGAGWQIDGWDEWPALHTPSNPPYVPELVETRLKPFQNGRLYRVAVPSKPVDNFAGPATIRPFDPRRLAGDLLPLLAAATENVTAGFALPDAAEAAFLLRSLGPESLAGYLAEVDGRPAGFALLGPDAARRARATRGGRSLWRRGAYAAASRLGGQGQDNNGRVFFAAVLPEWRRRSIGHQLWLQTLAAAHEHGWNALTIGPIWRPSGAPLAAMTFLEQRAAVPRQTYRLYERSF